MRRMLVVQVRVCELRDTYTLTLTRIRISVCSPKLTCRSIKVCCRSMTMVFVVVAAFVVAANFYDNKIEYKMGSAH